LACVGYHQITFNVYDKWRRSLIAALRFVRRSVSSTEIAIPQQPDLTENGAGAFSRFLSRACMDVNTPDPYRHSDTGKEEASLPRSPAQSTTNAAFPDTRDTKILVTVAVILSF